VRLNLETEYKHSAIGEIPIVFENEDSKRRGSWQQQDRTPETKQNKYEEQVNEWLQKRIIELHCDLEQPEVDEKGKKIGRFNTRTFTVFSGKLRFVNDFVHINKLIMGDTKEVPSIDDTFAEIAKGQPVIYLKIDLRSAYLQVPLPPSDRYITVFTCGRKRYKFITAPLGLKHIPSVFQRTTKSLLQDHDCIDFAYNHIDDILIYSQSLESHVEHVTKVLTALTSVNLTIGLCKYHFFAVKVPMVGFWLEVGGIRPNLNKLCNMMEWTRPTTKKTLQRLIGIINFFRRFIPNVTNLLLPLISVKEKIFTWTDQMKKCYKEIYKALIKDVPFLHFPIVDVTLELATDASDTAIGAAFFQKVDGYVRYLGFHSRVLKDAETRYSIPKKELLSAVFHIEYYRYLLAGRFFKLYMDNQVLTFVIQVHNNPKRDRTIMGWLSKLSEYSFEVYHLERRNNTLPDLTSRVQLVKSTGKSLDVTTEVEELLEAAHSIGHFGANVMYLHITVRLERNDIPNLKQRCLDCTMKCPVCLKINNYGVGYSPLRAPKMLLPVSSDKQ
jgi:hypothetical protein